MPKYQDVKPAHLSEGRTKRNGQLWWYCRKYFVDLSDERNILLNNSENNFEYFYLIIYDFIIEHFNLKLLSKYVHFILNFQQMLCSCRLKTTNMC